MPVSWKMPWGKGKSCRSIKAEPWTTSDSSRPDKESSPGPAGTIKGIKMSSPSATGPCGLKRIPFFCLILLAVCSIAQAQQDKGPSPKATQEAFKQGVLAAQKQQWLSALRYFEEARKAVPLAPEILFNLGLTEAEIPGRELRSLAWFKAYLAAVPDGPNTKMIIDYCNDLEKEVKGSIARLLLQARQTAGRFSDDKVRNLVLNSVAVAQAEAGNFMEAVETVYQIDGDLQRSGVYLKIAALQAQAGDIAGARKTLANCNNEVCDKHEALMTIARAQVKANKKPEAINTLAEDRDFITKYGKDKDSAYTEVASAQAQLGDIEGAKKTAALMVDTQRISKKKVSQVPGDPFEKKDLKENKKPGSAFFTDLIDSKLNKPYFLDLEGYFQFLAKNFGPREKVDALLKAAKETSEALKAVKQP